MRVAVTFKMNNRPQNSEREVPASEGKGTTTVAAQWEQHFAPLADALAVGFEVSQCGSLVPFRQLGVRLKHVRFQPTLPGHEQAQDPAALHCHPDC
jgi:hypothetical protein